MTPKPAFSTRPVSMHAQPVRGLETATRSQLFQGRFGRMFRRLPAAQFGRDEVATTENLKKLGKAMVADPDPIKDGRDGEESAIPSLYTYLGQFIDHDLTFDPLSSLQKQNDPAALVDFRTPAFDLDCIYGRGPDDQPYMYDGAKFVTGDPITGGTAGALDLPRAANGRAIIGDPRNDENTLVAQLQGVFLRFHNRMVDAMGPDTPFAAIQREVRFHYQYVVVNDFLPRIVNSTVLAGLKTNGHYERSNLEFYHWRNEPFMPVEFSGACYRFGHSMVRPGYRLNDDDATLQGIFPGLVGFQRIADGRGLDWSRFIPLETRSDADDKRRLQLAYRIDTSIVDPLGKLPPSVGGNRPSLAERNLLRGWRLGLPSGQHVAKAMGVTPLTDAQILIGKDADGEERKPITEAAGEAFAGNCPLWTYILAEAANYAEEVEAPTTEKEKIHTPKLGPVGGRIVAEVFLGLLFGDPNSYLSLDPYWTPSGGADYSLKDFIQTAVR